MTGQQLKNSILQEAIQGRLVSNLLQAGEKTGAELLQDILAERQKKENTEKGKKAKKLTLSTIEEEPWELPEGWCWCQIGDIFDHSAGKSLNSSKQSVGKVYQYLTTSNVYWEGINFDKVKEMPFTEEEYKKSSAIKNDILVCEGGDVGRSCIWTYDYTIGLQNHVHRLRSIKDTYVKFFFYVLMYFKATNIISAKGIGIGGFSANALKGLSIPLPPISIQKAIVAKIEELFPLVDEYDKAAGELKVLNESLPDKLRKSVLQEAIHGTLVPNDIPEGEATAQELLQHILKERQDRENKEKGKKAKKLSLSTIEEEPWELPEGWCWVALKDCISELGDGIHGTPHYHTAGEYFFVNGNNLNNGLIEIKPDTKRVDYQEYTKYKKPLNSSSVLVSINGTIGNIAYYNGEPVILGKSACYFNLTHILTKKYIRLIIISDYFFKYSKKEATGSTIKNLSLQAMRMMPIPLPPLSIQHRIVEKIEELFSAISQLKA